MDLNVENCSQKSLKSQNSFDWSEFDDALDLEQPPTFNSSICPFEITNYPSQLILSRNNQNKSSKVDSGVGDDSTSTAVNSQTSQVSFEGQKRITNHHQSTTPNPIYSSDIDRGCTSSPIAYSLPPKKSRFASPLPRTFSRQNSVLTIFHSPQGNSHATECQRKTPTSETDESNDSDTTGSEENHENVDAVSDDTENSNDVATPSTPSQNELLLNPIHMKIEPILNLMSQIKTQYTDYAFVYALAAHMCKDIYPRDCHITLKTALLLSIVSCTVIIYFNFFKKTNLIKIHSFIPFKNPSQGQNDDEQPVSIMAIARDSAATSTIMGAIGRVAKRYTNAIILCSFNIHCVNCIFMNDNRQS